MFAKGLAPNAYPGLYIALATDEAPESVSAYSKADVITALTQSGSIVFIDPGVQYDRSVNLPDYYQPLAVNGGAVEEITLTTKFTFPKMREAILGY